MKLIIELNIHLYIKGFDMEGSTDLPVTLGTKEDLDLLLKHYYELPKEVSDNQRFGQWCYNLYNIEHNNSYNEKNSFRAYVTLWDYFMLKGQEDE